LAPVREIVGTDLGYGHMLTRFVQETETVRLFIGKQSCQRPLGVGIRRRTVFRFIICSYEKLEDIQPYYITPFGVWSLDGASSSLGMALQNPSHFQSSSTVNQLG